MQEPTKRCPTCGEVKTASEFGRNKARSDGLSFYCRECGRSKNRAYRENNPQQREKNRIRLRQLYADQDRYLNYRYRNQYGISLDRYQELLAEQGGRCAICGLIPSVDEPRLAVDHDHDCCPTRKRSCGKCVRGLLCGNCNRGIGYMHDDPEVLRAAAEYLTR